MILYLICVHFVLWVILLAFLSSADFFLQTFFQKYHQSVKQFRSRSVEPDQDAHCLHFFGYQQMALDAKVLKTLANGEL